MIEHVLYEIPVEYRDRFQQLLQESPGDPEELVQELDVYMATVRRVSQMVTFLDLKEAEALAAVCRSLLSEVEPTTEAIRRLVHAAVRYFILEEDDDEVTGVLGFDDDIQVLNAVARSVGRADLVFTTRRTVP